MMKEIPKIEREKTKESLKNWIEDIEGKLNIKDGIGDGLTKIDKVPVLKSLITKEDLSRLIQISLEARLARGELRYVAEMEELAKEKGITLEVPPQKVFQKGFEEIFTGSNCFYERKTILEIAQAFQSYALEKGIKVEINQRIIEMGFEYFFYSSAHSYSNIIEEIEEFQSYVLKQGINEDIVNKAFQATFENMIRNGKTNGFNNMNYYSEDNGKKLEIPPREIFQKGFENILAEGYVNRAKDFEEYALKSGIVLETPSQEIFQKGFENCDNGSSRQLEFQSYALEKGIKIEISPKTTPGGKRDAIDISKEVKIKNISIKSEFHGEAYDGSVRSKFLLGRSSETEKIYFVFDTGNLDHKDIPAKHGLKLEVIGGGRLEIDQKNKRITIYEKSGGFGLEPRIISAAVVIDNFPGYEVDVLPG